MILQAGDEVAAWPRGQHIRTMITGSLIKQFEIKGLKSLKMLREEQYAGEGLMSHRVI